MIKRVVFVVDNPFNLRDFNRFGIGLLEGSGFKVEVWELTPLLYPRIYKEYIPMDAFRFGGLRTFDEADALKDAVSGLGGGDFLIDIMGYSLKTLPLHRALGRSSVRYASFRANALPPVGHGGAGAFAKKLLAVFRESPVKAAKETVFNRLPPSLFGARPPDFVLAGGGKSAVSASGSEVIWAHTLDYDIYLGMTKEAKASNRAVFLDEYLPFHLDLLMTGLSEGGLAGAYYGSMRRFFGEFERQSKMEVVVAAHPRSRYEEHPDYFGGRKIIKGETAELVRDSGAVLLHASTALNFAVLFERPVVFLTNGPLEKICPYEGLLIAAMASLFGKEPIDTGAARTGNIALDYNPELYRRYKEEYIKTAGSPELPFWRIVADRLKKL